MAVASPHPCCTMHLAARGEQTKDGFDRAGSRACPAELSTLAEVRLDRPGAAGRALRRSQAR